MKIISNFGNDAIAGYTIAIRIIIFAILPAWGMSNAAATMVGQNLGAGLPDRAEKSVWLTAFYNMVFLLGVTIVFYVFAEPIVGIFSDDPNILQSGITALQIICLGYVCYAYGMVISNAFNGAGDTKTPTLVNFVCFWMFEIPLGYYLAVELGLELAGVCWAIAAAETFLAIFVVILFRQGKWKNAVI